MEFLILNAEMSEEYQSVIEKVVLHESGKGKDANINWYYVSNHNVIQSILESAKLQEIATGLQEAGAYCSYYDEETNYRLAIAIQGTGKKIKEQIIMCLSKFANENAYEMGNDVPGFLPSEFNAEDYADKEEVAYKPEDSQHCGMNVLTDPQSDAIRAILDYLHEEKKNYETHKETPEEERGKGIHVYEHMLIVETIFE